MGIQSQAGYASSTLSRFLSDRLPYLDRVAQTWIPKLASMSDGPALAIRGRDDLGWALELRLGLDLAATPPRLRELSYLPIERCRALLAAAGYEHRQVGVLPLSGTTDPLLCHWERTRHPIVPCENQSAAFRACLDLAWFRQLIHKWGEGRTVDERRSWFVSLATHNSGLDGDAELLDAMAHCWRVYLKRGRRALLKQGSEASVAPELALGYGVADLVIGRMLIDVKLAVRPAVDEAVTWLRQLIGYVLLDRHNIFELDSVAVYCGWHGQLLSYPLQALLATAGGGSTPSLERLRLDFYEVMRDELDTYAAWRERQRHP
ncbi:hypothetical protein [Pseudonocardia humida]|uniref:Uncharacterized protein n=1 Tax=Pseudonocardia humida TaxID=2800819 RepID=A0ABT1A3B4_9PSEU|nr:hypothetical protein [Pseudonocardia humida]MCO1657344.1 hypothetical protein [Pseudonocardia humida]